MIQAVTPSNTIKPTSAGHPHNGTTHDGQDQVRLDREMTILRGDVAKRHDARAEREKLMREKQKKMTLAAETMSAQVLDERERLSLTSRSRATSRATSRTASPTGGFRTHREKAGHPPLSNDLAEGEEGKGDQSRQQDNVRVIS